jgi:hypothetical protein
MAEHCSAKCHLCWVFLMPCATCKPYILVATCKPHMLSVVILNVAMLSVTVPHMTIKSCKCLQDNFLLSLNQA